MHPATVPGPSRERRSGRRPARRSAGRRASPSRAPSAATSPSRWLSRATLRRALRAPRRAASSVRARAAATPAGGSGWMAHRWRCRAAGSPGFTFAPVAVALAVTPTGVVPCVVGVLVSSLALATSAAPEGPGIVPVLGGWPLQARLRFLVARIGIARVVAPTCVEHGKPP